MMFAAVRVTALTQRRLRGATIIADDATRNLTAISHTKIVAHQTPAKRSTTNHAQYTRLTPGYDLVPYEPRPPCPDRR